MLPVFLYGCWGFVSHIQEVTQAGGCDNWMLRKTFGTKSDEVTGKWVTTK